MPHLEAQRIAADTDRDPPIDADLAPGPTHQRLPRFPFLQDLQRAHPTTNANAAAVPSMEPTAKGQLVQRPVEAGLVVDLVGREMRHDILHAPAAAVAARGPGALAQSAKVRPQP